MKRRNLIVFIQILGMYLGLTAYAKHPPFDPKDLGDGIPFTERGKTGLQMKELYRTILNSADAEDDKCIDARSSAVVGVKFLKNEIDEAKTELRNLPQTTKDEIDFAKKRKTKLDMTLEEKAKKVREDKARCIESCQSAKSLFEEYKKLSGYEGGTYSDSRIATIYSYLEECSPEK